MRTAQAVRSQARKKGKSMKLATIFYIRRLLKNETESKLRAKEVTEDTLNYLKKELENGGDVKDLVEKQEHIYSVREDAWLKSVSALEDFENHAFS